MSQLGPVERATLLDGLCKRVDVLNLRLENLERGLDFFLTLELGPNWQEILATAQQLAATLEEADEEGDDEDDGRRWWT